MDSIRNAAMRKGEGRWFIKAIVACTAVSLVIAYFSWIIGIICWLGCLGTLAGVYEHLEMEDRE
jgi:predicted outer membrane lipoprotein